MNVTDFQEVWQIDVGSEIYEANFEVLTQWIFEGSVLPQDKVRRGNLRWIEARKVPALLEFFNAKENGMPPPVPISTTDAQISSPNAAAQTTNFAPPQNSFANNYQTSIVEQIQPQMTVLQKPPVQQTSNYGQNTQKFYPPEPVIPSAALPVADFCSMHPDTPAAFICDTCANAFCKLCPKSYGGTVKICPFCGAMCQPIEKIKKQAEKAFKFQSDVTKGFGFEDFFSALAYPFKFKTSLFFGAMMFMLFSLGQSASSFGGIFLLAASLFCYMLANMLTFGVLTNVLDNFSQGKIGANFMPGFDDFSLWDDVVHPFFLSIAVYLVSFGLFIVIVVGGIWYSVSSMTAQMNSINEQNQPKFMQNQETPFMNDEDFQELSENPRIGQTRQNPSYNEEEEFRKMNEFIKEQRKRQLESGIGKTPETIQQERSAMLQNMLKYALPVVLLGLVAFLWGLFYLPAACLVAGYTRSFVATLNPKIGLETIKILGFDYLKILMMGLIIVVASFFVGVIFGLIFFPFNLPAIGNLPANALAAICGFYFSVVFSVVLGFALYKNSDKLNLYKG